MLDGVESSRLAELMNGSDFIVLVRTMIVRRGGNVVSISRIKGHAGEDMVLVWQGAGLGLVVEKCS